MEINTSHAEKLKKETPVCESKDSVEKNTVSGLRKRWAVVIGLALAATFGGSCKGKLSCVGKEVVGCSCVDSTTQSNSPEPKKEERRVDF